MRPRVKCTAGRDLISEAEALQERRRAILPRRVHCSGVGYGRELSPGRDQSPGRDLSPWILLLLDPRAMMTLGPDLRACILHGTGSPLLFHWPGLGGGVLRDPYRRSLCGRGPCPRLFLRRPCLELLEQFFGDWRAGLGLALSDFGLPLTGLGLDLIGRSTRCGCFVARRRVRYRRRQILRCGSCLDG